MTLCAAHAMPHCRECNRTAKAPFGSARSELKKKRGSRHIRPADMARLIGKAKSAQNGMCAGLICDPEHECPPGDTFDPCHIVSQRTLVNDLGEGTPALTDERNILYACRTIHGDFDAGNIDLFDPEGFTDFCAQYGYEHNGRYWARVAAA